MSFCGKCGTQVNEGTEFCPSCGARMETQEQTTQQPQQQSAAQNDLGSKIAVLNNTADSTADFDQADIANNKVMAILAYLGILVLVPILAAKDSKFARYHSNQGLILCLAEIAFGIVYGIVNSVILAISWRLYFITSIIGVLGIVFLVLAVIGIVNVSQGKAKELPVIGKFKILKNS